jgi:aryl-alcohol dehydrogenase-like predicted oxidoreductase
MADVVASPPTLAMGAMRLSTAPDRDEPRALATLHAGLDAGVTLLDTADAYCWDAGEAGHNERLIARALATWSGDASRVRVATKGGLTRPGGRWVADGRARHLAAACEASRRALGMDRIHLYQLHAPDPRSPLATSLRALAALQKDGLVERIGVSNVSLGQLREALDVAPLAAVQVELSPWHDASLRGGVVELCAQLGILLLAHRPLGGAENRRRLAQDPVLRQVAERHAASPADVVLAWLRGLSTVVVPLPGPTRPETARALGRTLLLTAEDMDAIDARLATGQRQVVLDNTYLTRASRNSVLETAWARGVPVRCVWLQTSLEDAQVNGDPLGLHPHDPRFRGRARHRPAAGRARQGERGAHEPARPPRRQLALALPGERAHRRGAPPAAALHPDLWPRPPPAARPSQDGRGAATAIIGEPPRTSHNERRSSATLPLTVGPEACPASRAATRSGCS